MSVQLSLFTHINDVTEKPVVVPPVEVKKEKTTHQKIMEEWDSVPPEMEDFAQKKPENWRKCATCVGGDFVGAETCGRVDVHNKEECWVNDFKFYKPSATAVIPVEKKENPFCTCPRCGKNDGKLLVLNYYHKLFEADRVCSACAVELFEEWIDHEGEAA